MNLENDIALAHRLADAAAAAVRPYFRSGLAADRKSDATPVTEADRAAEEAMTAVDTDPQPALDELIRTYAQSVSEFGEQYAAYLKRNGKKKGASITL